MESEHNPALWPLVGDEKSEALGFEQYSQSLQEPVQEGSEPLEKSTCLLYELDQVQVQAFQAWGSPLTEGKLSEYTEVCSKVVGETEQEAEALHRLVQP